MDVLSYLLGHFCVFCGKLLDPSADPICPECTERIRRENLSLSPEENDPSVQALFRFAGCARGALHRFKYGNRRELGTVCGRRLADRFLQSGSRADAVTCVPRAKDGIPRRYNQSAVIARAFASRADLPFDAKLLRKREGARTQVQCEGSAARRRNAENAFRIGPSARDLTGCSVVLVDDLYTSGATADVCSQLLLKRGARQVFVYCAMRAFGSPPHLIRSSSDEVIHVDLAESVKRKSE